MASLLTRTLVKSSRTLAVAMRSTTNVSSLRFMASTPVPDSIHIAVVTRHIRVTKNDFLQNKYVSKLNKEEQNRAWELFIEDITEEGFISVEVSTEKAQIDRLIKEAVDNIKTD